MQIITCTDLIEVPWKNGGGTTREIAMGRMADQTAWRISRADVAQDGVFSDFTGLMRILTVVSGAGMVLEHASDTLDADIWEPVRFGGNLKIHSRLKDGPLTDLNLMFDPILCGGEVIARRGPFDRLVECPTPGILAFHALSGAPTINASQLTSGDTAFHDHSAATIALADGDALLEIRIRYLDQRDAIKLCIAD